MKSTLYMWGMGIMILTFSLISSASGGSNAPTADLSAASVTEHQLLQSIRMQEDMHSALKTGLLQRQKQLMFEQKVVNSLTPHVLIPEFLKFYKHNESLINEKPLRLSKRQAEESGSISGTVTVEGAVPENSIDVFVFDRHGFFVASASVSLDNGSYLIESLPADSFYVMTDSDDYVDEIYNNVQDPLHTMHAWKTAEQVVVADSAAVSNINFDLQTGAHIVGSIYDTRDSLLTDVTADFEIYEAVSGELFSAHTLDIGADGAYQLPIPVTGQFKVKVSVPGYLDTWAESALSQSQAVTLTLSSLKDEIQTDIRMAGEQDEDEETGSIAGGVANAFISIALAFDVSDTSLAGFGFGIFSGYSIEDLSPEDYYIYVNDYLAGGFGGINFAGKFYDGGAGSFSLSGAQPVTVFADSTLEDISVTLEPGGEITGQVLDSSGEPVDSLLLIAVRTDLMQQDSIPFPADVDIVPAITAIDGSYQITGLASGKYIIRTVSEYMLILDLQAIMGGNLSLDAFITDGKHKGQVVDAWYGDVYNLLSFGKAERVSVTAPLTVENIDIHLESPHYISGDITDAMSSDSVHGAWVIAMRPDAPVPFFRYVSPKNGTTSYRLGPLPPGQIKAAAIVNPLQNEVHLSEYYGNVRSFDQAPLIELSDSLTTGIDFALERGATVQGFVHLQTNGKGTPAGVDTLKNTQVIAFESETGKVATYNQAQFNSGFRLRRLVPGTYKILALPTQKPFAAAYHGGGTHYNHEQSQTLTVAQGEIRDIVLNIPHQTGSISGAIHDAQSDEPLSHIGVAAYDPSGHVSAMTVTRDDGSYVLDGLHAGEYRIRTLSLAALLKIEEMAESLLSEINLDDPMALLSGGLPDISGFSNLMPHEDMWYPGVPAVQGIVLDEFIFRIAVYGLPHWTEAGIAPIYLPIPYYAPAPEDAGIVSLTDGESRTDINFNLAAGIPVTDVNENKTVPLTFEMHQNAPNPFNPSTRITYVTPQAAQVTLNIYDVLGRHIRTLTDQQQPAGEHSIVWNAMNEQNQTVPAGLYFARINIGNHYKKSIKMMLIK
ncbi:MAG: FlgD immunoglobulin-like domain containing protein [candidate division KSB1 bacterium]|nr:FlgD immunoglobulin-like domain containing protein [candidate division KSB1 bacterium]